MSKPVRYIMALALFLLQQKLDAQPTIHGDTLSAAHVSEKRILKEKYYFVTDTLLLEHHRQQNLQSLLQQNSQAFIKNYGPGGLSTISLRGGSAAQTQIKWQDISLNSALTGLADLSSIPVNLFNQIRIQYNDISEAGIGGAVILSNINQYAPKHISASMGWESLNNQYYNLDLRLGNKKFHHQTRLFRIQQQNQFRFYHPEKDSLLPLEHARNVINGLMHDSYFNINDFHQIGIHIWLQEQRRQIPAAYFEQFSSKKEDVQTQRFVLRYQWRFRRFQQKISLGYFREAYQYQDSLIQFMNQSGAHQIPLNIKIKHWGKKNFHYTLSSENLMSFLIDRKEASLRRHHISLGLNHTRLLPNLEAEAMIRKEWTNLFELPWMYQAKLTYKLPLQSQMFISYGQNSRTPTLNELYFIPGGNPNLKPEISKALELGIRTEQVQKKYQLTLSSILYHKKVSDWIVWYGGAILTPHNIQEVWSRGSETELQLNIPIKSEDISKRLFWVTQIFHSYQLSTSTKGAFINDPSVGKQIPYVPRYQTRGSFGLNHTHWSVLYQFSYTGYRFVTTDESQYLIPYSISSISALYRLNFSGWHIHLNARANNLFNRQYEGVVGRVMPGRYFETGLQFSRNIDKK